MIGTSEIIIIAVVVLVLFGANALPKFGRSLGRFKKEVEMGASEQNPEEKTGQKEE